MTIPGIGPKAEHQAWSGPRIAHPLIVIIWHVLATGTPYTDLGAEFYERRADPDREARGLIAKLKALGRTVTIEPAA